MWFKNLQIYLLQEPFELTAEALHERLQERGFRKCGTLEMATIGWRPPLGRAGTQLIHAVGKCIMICASKDEKVLPAAVINQRLGDRVAEIEAVESRPVHRREQRDLRDEIIQDLMPKAFSRSSETYAYIDQKNGWLIVDTASTKRAEELITLLRETLGNLKVKPLEVELSPAAVLTDWVKSGSAEGFLLMDECELRDPVEEGAIVRCRRQELDGDEIAAHLKAGKQVVRLALLWGERIGLVLTEDMSVKRLKFLDVILEEAADAEAEDAAARFDVDFSLMTLELGRFIPQLLEPFGGIAERS